MVSIPDADDGVIDANDIADGVALLITLPESTQPGDVIVTVTDGDNNATEVITPVPADWNGSSPMYVNILLRLWCRRYSYIRRHVKDEAGNYQNKLRR